MKSREAMSIFIIIINLLLISSLSFVSTKNTEEPTSFIYNGFQSSNLTIDSSSSSSSSSSFISKNGLLCLTHFSKQQKAHAFFPNPIHFTTNTTISFSTTFVFAITSEFSTLSGHGITFFLSPSKSLLSSSLPSQFLGLFNESNNGNPENHIFAVELDTIQNQEFEDINDNHVGIDINGLNSVKSAPAGYYINGFQFQNLSLNSGFPIQVWVDYNGDEKEISVTLAPIDVDTKPKTPLLKLSQDLSSILTNPIYVGFSASTGSILTSHYVLGWSFDINGREAKSLIISELPELPQNGNKLKNEESMVLFIVLPVISLCLIFLASLVIFHYFIKRKRKFSEILENWEQDYGPHRFKYKDLYFATKGFREKELLGSGGFGRVYKGTLPISKTEVAVKRVSHKSRQGMREFVAEIVSIGRLRHRNLVPLLGYCRRKQELLLVYDFMPNGSLDKYLHNQPTVTLNWTQRFRIIKGIASGLCYLHDEWEQVVVHRDIKASNILLDSELNGRLGDFGLARLYDHGSDPKTTSHVVGTLGYLAPEQTRTGKATTSSDVFSFGAFMLEVVCGKRPIGNDNVVLVDWVYECFKRGQIVEAKDENIREYREEEVELVLKLGLLCSNSEASSRPRMRHVVQYLNMDMPLPDLSSLCLSSSSGLTFGGIHCRRGDDSDMSFPVCSMDDGTFSQTSSIAESLLSGGR